MARTPQRRTIAHVDMDAFYASVEIRDDPGLAGKPVVVGGGPDQRGVVMAASYEARRYGIHSAMPMARAVALCSTLVRVPGDMSRYKEASRRVMRVLSRFSPLVEPLSLDEAFVDLTGTERSMGTPGDIGQRIKSEIERETRLVASVGIAPVKFAAKIASDLEKPDGLVVVPHDGVEEFLDPLPIGRLWGVGPKSRERLESMGITTIGELARADERRVLAAFGKHGAHLIRLANGRDARGVVPSHDAKSYSHEITYAKDQTDAETLRATLLDQATSVARRLRRDGVRGRTVTLKLRDHRFSTITRQKSATPPIDDAGAIYERACRLLGDAWDGRPVRLVGVGVSNISRASDEPPGLFDDARSSTRRRALDETIDTLERRFGRGKVVRAGAMRARGTRDTGWVRDEEDD